MKPAEIDHWTNALEELEKFLRTFPMSKHYRETTTFRQFNEMLVAKQREMGLTEDVLKELRSIEGNEALDSVWLEISMTIDHRELMAPKYYYDLPLNYFMMDEYQKIIDAVENYTPDNAFARVATDEELFAVVQQHLGIRLH